jgi:putative salt-induced outer membrane protein YdiY
MSFITPWRTGRSRFTSHVAARVAVVLALLVCLAASVVAQVEDPGEEGASDIREREEALVAATNARDYIQLDQLLSPDYVLRGTPDIDRDTWLSNAISLCWGKRAAIDHFQAWRRDDVAIASFEITFYADPVTCRPAVLRSLMTDVWVRGASDWQLQVRHASPPPSPAAGVAAQFGVVPLPPPEWEVSSELSLVATGGNTSTRTVGIGADMLHRGDRVDTRGTFAYLSSEADSVTQARSLRLQGRPSFRFGPRLQAYADGEYTRDQFGGIDGRTTGTLGVAYVAPVRRPHSLTIEGGGGVTNEQRVGGETARFFTASAAAHYAWALTPGSRLTQDVAFNGDLWEGSNWRSTSVTSLSVTVTRLLSLKASHSIEYRNAPVTGFRRTDMRSAAALVFSMQRRHGTP